MGAADSLECWCSGCLTDNAKTPTTRTGDLSMLIRNS